LVRRSNDEVLVDYGKAKIAADHYFARQSAKRAQDQSFQGITLRPGTLSDDHEVGKISLGKTKAVGKISRGDVAEVATQLLARDDTRGWYDLQQGQESIADAIAKCIREGVDSVEGEDLG
jgi:nucleoside-diphosphate-sugar epimerase